MARKTITSLEFLKQLENDEVFQQQRSEQEKISRQREQKILEAQAILLKELKSVDIDITSVWELVNTSDSYVPAIPILLRHLRLVYSDAVKDGIARALTVKEARDFSAGSIILNELISCSEKDFPRAKWAMANALTVVASPADVDGIISLIKTNKNFIGRDELVKYLKRKRKYCE